MPLFGLVHVSLLITIVVVAALLTIYVRRRPESAKAIRLILGGSLAGNELIWWCYRYSQEGFRFPHNLPLQLCDVTLWAAVFSALTLAPWLIEFNYFAGIAGAGMALLTPDLWSPWPTYPAVYFFLAHGGIVIIPIVLIYGGVVCLRPRSMWFAFAMLLSFAVLIGIFNAITGENYMYLCRKPANASPLDAFGPWPWYLLASNVLALFLFWLLWLPVRRSTLARAKANASA